MADSNTETTATPDGTTADHGSEFSKGTGSEDAAIWDKYFGKEAKEPKPDKPKTADGKKAGAESKSADASDKKPRSEPSKASTKPPADAKSDDPKPTPDKGAKASKEPTGGKTADKDTEKDDDAPADPEAPLKKARDLYGQAKKTEDRREARKLYKRAMVEAFGEIPDEFDDKRYAAVRTERAAAKATLDEQAKKNETRFSEAVSRLKPAIFVMRKLEEAKFSDQITVPMVEQAIHVMRAIKGIEDGDFTQLAEVVSRAAKVDHDEAMKRFVKGVKVSPEGKAARQAADEARREAAEARRELAEMRKQLTDRDSSQTEAQKKQDHERRVQEQHAVLLDDIQENLDGHAVLSLPRGAERVKAYLIRTADPKLKSFRYSYAQVADKLVAGERRRLQSSRHLLDEGEPARETPRRSSTGSVSRTETVDAGVRSQDPEVRFGEIFDKHASARVAGGRRR